MPAAGAAHLLQTCTRTGTFSILLQPALRSPIGSVYEAAQVLLDSSLGLPVASTQP
jgi:hypothetical protein